MPIIINTSFNVRGEPIVCSPHDAYLCFMRTNMDVLVLGNQILRKEDQPELVEDFDWREKYALDAALSTPENASVERCGYTSAVYLKTTYAVVFLPGRTV